jgi:serine/threonine protein kinase
MMPNTLSEGMISGILNDNIRKEYCPLFGTTVGLYHSVGERTTYALMEKYTDVERDIFPEETVLKKITSYYVLFQIAYALAWAQDNYEFTHYDLHAGNILFERTTANNMIYWIRDIPTNPAKVFVYSPAFNVKIIDFGFARAKNGNVIVHPRVGIKDFLKNYGLFNPYYDLTYFIGVLIAVATGYSYSAETGRISQYIASSLGKETLIEILKYMYAGDETFDYNLLFYPNTAKPYHMTLYHSRARNMHTMCSFFLEHLIALGVSTNIERVADANSNITVHQYADRYMNVDSVNPITLTPGFTLHYPSLRTALDKWVARRTLRPIYHHTYPNTTDLLPHHVINVMYINSKIAYHNGYRFVISCCKEDPKNYMRNKIGVAINGGFFDISRSFLPIGPYIQIDNYTSPYESFLEIPEIYRKDYGVIIIDNNEAGLVAPLIMKSTDFDPSKFPGSSLFVSGPILMLGGQRTFNNSALMTAYPLRDKTILPFQCMEATQSEKAQKYLNNPTRNYLVNNNNVAINALIPNCSMIEPGELSHAGNPNPRSMLITRHNTDGLGDYAFVVVEGRGDRGSGVDLDLLAFMAEELGAINAINLDGGSSSELAWRFNTHNVYTNKSPENHVAGNILAIVKIFK